MRNKANIRNKTNTLLYHPQHPSHCTTDDARLMTIFQDDLG